KKGAKNFWKGVVSPLQMMVDSPIAAGATVLGGIGIGQLAKKFRRIGIPLVVASSIAGAVDIGKGVYKFVTAKTSEDKEKSFYNVGQGSLVTGLSVLSSQKVAIANSDIIKSVKVVKNKPQISHLKAFAECWKKTPKVVGDIFKSLGDNKALATALGVTGATTGAEMTSNLTDHGSPSNDVPDVNVTQDILNEMPQQVQKAAELFSAAGEDPSSAFALKQNMEKNKDE
ncbi:MAG: hypothetical protein GX568_06395, partial [Candidatus Gastranaerophilales bacterium]|nr:hypothetical protein [Candidatus Gastranaerophilales bacterium]